MECNIKVDSSLLQLWQQRKVQVKLMPLPMGSEVLAIEAILFKETTSLEEIKELVRFFNDLVGTQFTLAAIEAERSIERESREGHLSLAAKTLWMLELETVTFPLYAVAEEDAEFIALQTEQLMGQQRKALRAYPEGYQEHAGLLLLLSYAVYR